MSGGFKLDTSMTITKRDKMLLVVVGVILILVLGVMFAIMPLVNSLQNQTAKLKNLQQEKASTAAVIAGIPETEKQLDEAMAKAPQVKARYMNLGKMYEVDRYIDSMAGKYGLQTKSISMNGYKGSSISLYEAQGGNMIPVYPYNQQTEDAQNSAAGGTKQDDATAVVTCPVSLTTLGDFANVEKLCSDLETNVLGLKVTSVYRDLSKEETNIEISIYAVADISLEQSIPEPTSETTEPEG